MTKRHASQYARGVRLTLGEVKPPGSIEQREKLVMQITRRIHAITAQRKALKAKDHQLAEELKAQRRGLRVALQQGERIESKEEEK